MAETKNTEKQNIEMMELQNIDLQDKTEDLTADSAEKNFTEEEFSMSLTILSPSRCLKSCSVWGIFLLMYSTKLQRKTA